MLHQTEIICTFAATFTTMEAMFYIDTHTHLYDEAFRGEEDAAVRRALEAGVSKMILPDIDSVSRDGMFALAERHPGHLYPCLGLHPTSVGEDWRDAVRHMEQYLDRRIYAIGETGMDCYWSREFVEEQKKALEYQIRLACRLDLPLIIHSREATGLIFDVLDKCRGLEMRGTFHAFSGSLETFGRLQKYGDWYVGIGGVLTYKNASIAETVKHIPLSRILLETDSPYLTPVPKRGTRNESGYIPYIAGRLSEIKGTDIEEVAAVTTENAIKLFSLYD